MNLVRRINLILSKISFRFVKILFCAILLGMLSINSVYLYIDTPDFRMNNIWNYLGILINVIGMIGLIFLNKLPKKIINPILFLLYLIAEIAFLKLVPIKPFSDMLFVTQIASSNFTEGIEYLQACTNNLPTVILFNLIFRITTYDVFVLRVCNIICNIGIIYFAYKTYENIYGKKNNLVILLGLCFIPAFLYVNNTYNDIIFTMLVTMILYFVTKNFNSKLDRIAVLILLFLQFIIRPVGIIIIIAVGMYYFFKQRNIKMLLAIVLTFVILNLLYMVVKGYIIPKTEEDMEYPIWSYIQMGFNEAEFGFQDGSHSTKWTFGDVKNRIIELGSSRLLKLLAKKEFWLWTEGTYQVERYAFGIGDTEQFFYDTPITNQLYDVENSNLRKAFDYVMKGQYFVILVFAFMGLFSKGEQSECIDKKELLLYIIVGMFCFYLIWEIKSRYIYCLYPIFLILCNRRN